MVTTTNDCFGDDVDNEIDCDCDDCDNEQARKSSEDTHLTGYTRFEKVFGLGKLSKNKLLKNTLSKNTLSENTLLENTLSENTLSENILSKNTLVGKIIGVLSLQLFTQSNQRR